MAEIYLGQFSFANWYPTFERISPESIIIPIPMDVRNYILKDIMVLPKETSSTIFHDHENTEQNYSVDWTVEDETDELEMPTFPVFSAKLKNAMNELGGQVFIKTNLKSPSDATWLVPGRTLKCTCLLDIYSLLKGSHIVAKDLSQDYLECSHETIPCVIIKEWIDLQPGCEFRCFVTFHQLIAISQRDHRSYYQHIAEEKFDIMEDILKFFRRNIKGRFELPNYVFDVARTGKNNIILLDFQPFHRDYTNGLLFSWKELEEQRSEIEDDGEPASSDDTPEQETEKEPEFRFLGENPGLMRNSCQLSGYPYELTTICDGIGNICLEQFMAERNFQNLDCDSSGSDDILE